MSWQEKSQWNKIMKILKIRFRNINSFYQKLYTIDFTQTPLSDAHLFIISGPTGAGKSTLLDVITLALYNVVPRFGSRVTNSEIAKLGSVINARAMEEPRAEAYAEVEYEVKSGRYRSSWSIAKNRNGNWNDYQMEIARLPEEVLLDVKSKADYPRKNAELIGLTYEQFVKSIVLAQGSFAEFLKADRHTRARLLEDLTGTHIYRKLGIGAFDQLKASAEVIKFKEVELKGVELKTPEEIDVLQAQKVAKEQLRKDLEVELDKWEKEGKLASDIQELENGLSRIRMEKVKLVQEEERFATDRTRLEGHERVSQFVGPMTRFAELEKQLLHTREELRKNGESALQMAGRKVELLNYATTLTGHPCDESNLVTHINLLEQQVLELEQLISNLQAQAKPLKETLRTEYSRSEFEWVKRINYADPQLGLSELVEMKKSFSEGLAAFPEGFSAAEKLRALDGQLLILGDLKGMVTERERLGNEGKKCRLELEQMVELEKQLTPETEQLRQEVEKRKAEIEELTEKLLVESTRHNLEDHRKSLKEGEPCPLCGSTHHPFLHSYVSQVSSLGEKITQLKFVLREVEKKEKAQLLALESARNRQVDLGKRLKQMREDYGALNQRVKELLMKVGISAEGDADAVNGRLTEVQQEKNRIDEWLSCREQSKLADRLSEMFRNLWSINRELSGLLESKKKIYSGEDIRKEVKSLLSNWEQLRHLEAENQRQKAELEDRRTNFETSVQALREELEIGLQNRGIDSVETARQLLLTGEEFDRLKKEQDRLREWSRSLAIQESEMNRTLSEKVKQRLFPELTREELTGKLSEIKKSYQHLLEEIASLQNQLRVEAENRLKFEKIQTEVDQLKQEHQKWELLAKYIGDATGNKFSAFAQSLTLSNLIGLANARLQKFSDRYILAKPENDSDSLYVLDTYYGNQSRATSTLSGGETFTVSLALALALSDLASRNVKIESLFIDEGFGTLDGEMLESAVSILERMQDESSKMIGVISHRQEMKERIPVQIQVDKSSDGTSSIRIIG